jgi:hypothetical protein
MHKSVFLFLLFFVLRIAQLGAQGYTTDDFSRETADFLALDIQAVKNNIPSLLSINKYIPFFVDTSISFDISICESIAPLAGLNIPGSGFQLYHDLKSIYSPDGEGVPEIRASFQYAPFPYLAFALNGGYFPGTGGNRSASSFLAGAHVYYSLIQDSFTVLGIIVGTGYSYTGGRIVKNNLDLQYTDPLDTTITFNGNTEKDWGYHAIELELLLQKTYILVNFFSRNTVYCIFGGSSSTVDGTLSIGGNVTDTRNSTESFWGAVTTAGMELRIDFFNIYVEAGLDWISSSFSGSAGMRIAF